MGTWAFAPEFLGKRMSFISGPRQVGKTTLALLLLEKLNQRQHYYNWDTLGVKGEFARNPLFFLERIPEPPPPPVVGGDPKYWVVFDEFHKHRLWKEFLKGYYDEFGHFIRFVVCGSARLDVYRRGGESLIGRYFPFRMFPLGPWDVVEGEKFDRDRVWMPGIGVAFPLVSPQFKEAVLAIYKLTGFPEPFIDGREEFYRRWRDEHISLLTTEEVRDLSRISDMVRFQALAMLLPERVGSLLSINNLAQTLLVAHSTVSTWLDAMEQVYLVFRVSSYFARLSRVIKKAKKLYFWDWGVIEEQSKRLENFLAVQLTRAISAWTEWGKGSFSLFFVRTKDGREVDFLITWDGRPWMLVEVKLSETRLDNNLAYFKEALGCELAFQVVLKDDYLRQAAPGIFVIDLVRFMSILV